MSGVVVRRPRCPRPYCGGYLEITRGALRESYVRGYCLLCSRDVELRDPDNARVKADRADRRAAGLSSDPDEAPLPLLNARTPVAAAS